MTDKSPASTSRGPEGTEAPTSRPLDAIEKSMGEFGRYHAWITFVALWAKYANGFNALSILFLAPNVTYHCEHDPVPNRCWDNCTKYIYNRSVFEETIISEWDMVCDRVFLQPLSQSLAMFGILVGNPLFGYISDRFGRKNTLTGAVALNAVTGIGAGLADSVYLFLCLRFLSLVATGGSMVTCFVFVIEMIGRKWRTAVCILYHIPFTIGHLCLPGVSYLFRHWRHFQLCISLPCVPMISFYCLLPETPRWLLNAGKKEEAIKVLERAARCNKLPTENIRKDIDAYLEQKKTEIEIKPGNFLDLFKTPTLRVYTLTVGFCWFACGFCFYGSAQYLNQLGGNIFLNVAFSALIQIPGIVASIWAMECLGRRLTLILSNSIAGLSMMATLVLPSDPPYLKAIFVSMDMCGIMMSFSTVYIYSGELFPTMLRNIGVGTSSMCARVGSTLAPFLLQTGVPWVPPVGYGVMPLIGVLLCFLLPETVGCKLPETIEEAEELKRRSRKTALREK